MCRATLTQLLANKTLSSPLWASRVKRALVAARRGGGSNHFLGRSGCASVTAEVSQRGAEGHLSNVIWAVSWTLREAVIACEWGSAET